MDHINFPYRDLGQGLSALRGNKTKTDFAKALGVTLRTYMRYENGERKIPDGLMSLAQILSEKNNDENRDNSNHILSQIGNFSDRLSDLVDNISNGKPSIFAKDAGIPHSTFYGYLKGRTPNADHLIRLHNKFGVNINWLLTGFGDKFIDKGKVNLYIQDFLNSILVLDEDEKTHEEIYKKVENGELIALNALPAKQGNIDNYEVISINATNNTDALKIARHMIQYFGEVPNASNEIMSRQLITLLNNRAQKNKSVLIVVVNNAHLLSSRTLFSLKMIRKVQDKDNIFREIKTGFVLIGDIDSINKKIKKEKIW